MGGLDKGWIQFEGSTLIERVIERFAPQVDRLLINANRHAERYAALGHPVISDVLPDFPGPLAGLHAAFGATSHDWLATCPCDSPWLPLDLVDRLWMGCAQAQAQAAIARTKHGSHPVFALVQPGVSTRLDAYLRGGGRRVGDWYRTLRCVEVEFPDEEAFRNLNAPGDLLT